MGIRFRIIENAPPKYMEKYDEFIDLYNNSSLTIEDIRKRLDWTCSVYNQARKKALSENKLNVRNPNYKGGRSKNNIKNNPKYYHRTKKGKYVVHKNFYNGRDIVKSVYGGIYKYEWQAQKVVEEFKKVGWDESQLNNIKEKVVKDDR